MSDLLTVAEQKGEPLGKWRYAWLGDGNNMANSWIEAAGQLKLDLRLACPAGYKPEAKILDEARRRGGKIVVVDKPLDAVAGADVVNTDVWASMGQERKPRSGAGAFAATSSTTPCWPRRPRTRSSCTACPRTAARRSPTP